MSVKLSSPEEARSSLREEQLALTRERILNAAIELLEQGAADTTLRAVARQAHISERTLYRHFETRQHLSEALAPRLAERVGAPPPARVAELPCYAKKLFDNFEANRDLVLAMVTSAEITREDLQQTRSDNLRWLRRLLDDAFPCSRGADRAAAASSLRVVLSGAGWVYLRVSCNLPAEEVLVNAQWTIATVLDRLGRGR